MLRSNGFETSNLDPIPLSAPDSRSIQGSILDRVLVSDAVSQCGLIIHIAAWHGFHAFTGTKSATDFWDLNMTGTFNLLEAAAQRGVKNFLFISSTSVDEWPEFYGTTKRLGEELCRSYAERYGMRVVCLRPRAFIPWWNREVYSSFEEWAAWFMRGAVHIDDVAQSVILGSQALLRSSTPLFEVVEIDGKREISDADLSEWTSLGGKEILLRIFPELSREIERAPFISDTPPTYKSSEGARRLLGYSGRYGIRELLTEYRKLSR